MAVGILGGTFDPVHIGHLITASALLEKRNLEKIIFVPCYISPHKLDFKAADAEDRLEMLRLALEVEPRFELCDYEIKKGGISYSLDTILMLKEKYESMELIIGYDNLIKFDSWREPDLICSLAQLVVLRRKSNLEIVSRHRFFDSAVYVDTPVVDISSTDIRNRIASGLSVNYVLPPAVEKYVRQKDLYR